MEKLIQKRTLLLHVLQTRIINIYDLMELNEHD